MHYTLLVAIEIPKGKNMEQVRNDTNLACPKDNKSAPEGMIDSTGVKISDSFTKFFMKRSDFETMIEGLADIMLAPYCQGTENPEYLSLWDRTDDGLEKYETGYADFVKMPDGRVLPKDNYGFSRQYEVFNGQVYRKRFGQLHHRKRTKKARRFQVLPSRSFKEIYPTFDDFMKRWWGAEYEEDTGRYGYYINPNGMWDGYQIGGRWPFRFLTKRDVSMKVRGELPFLSDEVSEWPAPDGYQWIAGAMKGDIAWGIMQEFYRNEHREQFHRYEQWLQEGEIPEKYESDYQISNDTIISWGDIVYHQGETEENYLRRVGLGPECHYPIYTAAILDTEGLRTIYDTDMKGYEKDEKVRQAWARRVSDFIAKQPEDMLLLSVDCHM